MSTRPHLRRPTSFATRQRKPAAWKRSAASRGTSPDFVDSRLKEIRVMDRTGVGDRFAVAA